MSLISIFVGVAVAFSAQVQRDVATRPAAGTAAIVGVVVTDGNSAQPIRRSIVTISGTDLRGDRQFITDDTGRFAFDGLPAGRYTLTAEKPAYVKTYYGSKRAGRAPGTPIVLADGQRAEIQVPLVRGAVIAGVVTDENGQALGSSQVTAMQPVTSDGQRKLVNATVPWATTDERGHYRIFGLPPGEYTVTASAGSSASGVLETTEAQIQAALRDVQLGAAGGGAGARVPPPQPGQISRSGRYFPSAIEPADATVFALAAGEERLNIDISLGLVRAARVEGLSSGPSGQPMPNVWVVLAVGGDRGCWSPGAIRPDAEGRFSMSGLGSGQYTLIARGAEGGTSPAGAPVAMPLWAETEFTMSGENLSNVLLQFVPGMAANGRVVFQGTQPPPDLDRLRLSLTRTSASRCGEPTPMPTVSPKADGTFSFSGLPPGKYRVTATGVGSAWALRSARLNEQDTLDVPFEIRAQDVSGLEVAFTDAPSELSGVVTDSLGRPAPEYSVVAFAADRALWSTAPRRLSGAIKLGSDGRYRIVGLPPGEYFIAVLTDIDARQASDPTILESLIPASMRISLGEGEKKTQNLRLGG